MHIVGGTIKVLYLLYYMVLKLFSVLNCFRKVAANREASFNCTFEVRYDINLLKARDVSLNSLSQIVKEVYTYIVQVPCFLPFPF